MFWVSYQSYLRTQPKKSAPRYGRRFRSADFIGSEARSLRSPAGFALRRGGDLVYAQVRAVEFFFRVEADADRLADRAINQKTAAEGDAHAQQGADELRHEADAAQPAQRFQPEYACRDAAPCAAQSMQRPDAKHVVYLPAVLRQGKHQHEQTARNAAGYQSADGMHQV